MGRLLRPGRAGPPDDDPGVQERRRGTDLDAAVHGRHRAGRPGLWEPEFSVDAAGTWSATTPTRPTPPQPETRRRALTRRPRVARHPRHRRLRPGLRPPRDGGRPEAAGRPVRHDVRDLRLRRPVLLRGALPRLPGRLGLGRPEDLGVRPRPPTAGTSSTPRTSPGPRRRATRAAGCCWSAR
ncbi:hypothetical protein NKH77_25555 [Streptomyces sp. M19]